MDFGVSGQHAATIVTLQMEAAYSSKTLISTYNTPTLFFCIISLLFSTFC
jgi:hypothetical protein